MQNTPGHVFVVLNPVAGSADAALIRRTLEQACRAASLDCRFYETTGREDLPEVVRRAAGSSRRVVAAGGDGTIAAVANGLVHGEVPMAVLPVGTANLLARELGIPLDLEEACRLAIQGRHIRRIDALRVEGRIFVSHVSVGVYSHIAERTTPWQKRYFRQLAYLWHALPALLGRRAWKFDLETDGRRHRIKASSIMIANVGGMGAATLRWGPDIVPDDGRVDLCIVKARSIKHYASLAWHMLRGKHKESRLARYMQAHHTVRVHCKKRLPVRGDGEIVGHYGVDLEILPRAVRIVVPDTTAQSKL